MKRWHGFAWIAAVCLLLVLVGMIADQLLDRHGHTWFACAASATMFIGAVASLIVEFVFGGRGAAGIVTQWFGTVLRTGLLVAAGLLGRIWLDRDDEHVWWFWLLGAYLSVLLVESIWLVCWLDRTSKVKSSEGEKCT